jgi:hypothetical protein
MAARRRASRRMLASDSAAIDNAEVLVINQAFARGATIGHALAWLDLR